MSSNCGPAAGPTAGTARVGAVYTLVDHHMFKELPIPIVTFVLLIGVVYARRKEARTLSETPKRSEGSL